MTDVTQKEILEAVENGWGKYVEKVHSLPVNTQAEFIQRQGYARLSDLLGHVIAWWEVAIPRIPVLLADPDCPGQEFDVDRFNAEAVARFRDYDERTMIALFESTRKNLYNLIVNLPTDALRNPRVNERLYMETIGHLSEHAFQD
jgi:hypothetical protein